jgi:tetratricopeptide (TPR) repeat protein
MAEQFSDQALSIDPSFVEAMFIKAVCASKRGDYPVAARLLDKVLAEDPEAFEAIMWRCVAARKMGDFDLAVSLANRAVAMDPNNFQVQNNLGVVLLSAGRLQEALAPLVRSLELNGDFAPTHQNMGLVLWNLGRLQDSATAFARAVELDPTMLMSVNGLSAIYLELRDLPNSIKFAKRSIKLQPNQSDAYFTLAQGLFERGDLTESEEAFRKGMELDPQGQNASAVGFRYQQLGQLEKANEWYRKDIEMHPGQGKSYNALVHNIRVSETDRPLVEQMLEVMRQPRIPVREQTELAWALGKALEDLKEYPESIQHYELANGLEFQNKTSKLGFDPRSYREAKDKIIRTFDAETIERERTKGNPSEIPIFVVGQMRSGTTLVETILSRHPMVAPAGEQPFWSGQWSRIVTEGPEKLADEYLEVLKKYGAEGQHVTDKMPRNYEVVGPMHIAFPNARFIHMSRNAADTCLSIYTTPNKAFVEFANNKANIATAYREYLRLADHWQKVIPADRFLDVSYEDLVSNQDTITRQIVEFCGLPWDDACLTPEKADRSVTTPSIWQVRQPLYTNSIARWKRFEPWIPEFVELLSEGR